MVQDAAAATQTQLTSQPLAPGPQPKVDSCDSLMEGARERSGLHVRRPPVRALRGPKKKPVSASAVLQQSTAKSLEVLRKQGPPCHASKLA